MKNNLKGKQSSYLLSINELSKNHILQILELADSFYHNTKGSKKVPILRGKTIFNLFLKVVQELERLLKLQQKDYQLML